MNSLRILVAAIAGGVIVFLWGAVSHMALPIGEMGVGKLPNEDRVLSAMKGSITEHGMYLFPGMPEGELSQADKDAWSVKYAGGPRGVLIFDPTPDVGAMSPRMLGTEFVSNAAAALLAAIILAFVRAGYVVRVLLVMLMGIFAWLSVDVSWWNWHRVPTDATIGALLDQGPGWLFAGLAMAAIVKPCGGGAEFDAGEFGSG